MLLWISITLSLFFIATKAQFTPQTITNGVVTLGISGTRGGSIDTLQVLGQDVIDVNDLGREIQASIFIPVGPHVYNAQDSGNMCGLASKVYGLNSNQSANQINVGDYPEDWGCQGTIPGLRIEGNHMIGPLPYCAVPQAIRLYYHMFADQAEVPLIHVTADSFGHATPIPFLPAIYFKRNMLNRLFGLSSDGEEWLEVTNVTHVNDNGAYMPSLFYFRSMAWMTSDIGWGVGLYGRWTLNQTRPQSFNMTLPNQSNLCPNFAAEDFPDSSPNNDGTTNLSLLDMTISAIPAGGSLGVEAHMAVGDLGTIQDVINAIYNAGY